MIISRELEKYNFSETIHSRYPNLKILFLDKQTCQPLVSGKRTTRSQWENVAKVYNQRYIGDQATHLNTASEAVAVVVATADGSYLLPPTYAGEKPFKDGTTAYMVWKNSNSERLPRRACGRKFRRRHRPTAASRVEEDS